MRIDRSAALALTVAIGSLAGSAAAAADRPGATSDETFKQALEAYDAGRYREAIELYVRVYRDTHVPALLFNIAQAARQLGDCPRALAHYRRFVADAPASPDRPRAEAWIAELGDCGGAPVPPILLPAPASAPAAASPAGPAPASGAPTLTMNAQPGATKPGTRPSRLPAVLLFAGAAALAGGGTLAAVQAHDAEETISRISEQGGKWDDAAIAVDAQGHRDQTWSVVLFSAAVACAAAAVALLVHASRAPRPAP
jgi:tetratricopeptide (TPR) repeat protein